MWYVLGGLLLVGIGWVAGVLFCRKNADKVQRAHDKLLADYQAAQREIERLKGKK